MPWAGYAFVAKTTRARRRRLLRAHRSARPGQRVQLERATLAVRAVRGAQRAGAWAAPVAAARRYETPCTSSLNRDTVRTS